jgi:dTDP-4-amino-4,6-dideoxygalactose transaminase
MSGTNSKMSELDCAHLLVRANHLEGWQWRRKQIRYYYLEQFKDLPLRCLSRDFTVHADQKFVVYTENRDDLHEHLKKHNIESKVHYPYALSELPIARKLKRPDIVSTSVMLTKGVLSLPIYPELSDGEVEYISTVVRQFYDK